MDYTGFTANSYRSNTQYSIIGKLLTGGPGGFVIVQPCLCVQDSPENPCPCPDIFKILIPKDAVIGEMENTGRKSSDQQELIRIWISRRQDVMLEATVPFNNSDFFNSLISRPKPMPNPLGPILTGPTVPVPPEDNEPDITFLIGGLIWGLAKKYGPGVVGAVGGFVLAEIFDNKSCTTTETTETYTNSEGKTVTRTVKEEVCD